MCNAALVRILLYASSARLPSYSLLLVFRQGRSPEQIGGLYPQDSGKSVDHVDAGSIDTPLERADIGTVNLRSIGKLFL
jgi:hypothetical protein